MQAYAISFDRGFGERDVFHDETGAENEFQARDQVKKLDPSTLPLLGATAAVTNVRVPGSRPCNPKR